MSKDNLLSLFFVFISGLTAKLSHLKGWFFLCFTDKIKKKLKFPCK